MRAKFIYEKFKEDSDPIKDLGIGMQEILFLTNKRVVFYHSETGKFEYRGKIKDLHTTPQIASMLKTKKFIIYVKNDYAIGWTWSNDIASHIWSGYGATYIRLDLYKKFKKPIPIDLIRSIVYKHES